MSMSSIPSPSPTGSCTAGLKRSATRFHTLLLFIYLIVVLAVATAALSAFGVGDQPDRRLHRGSQNLLSIEGLHWFLPNVIKNFSGFVPLGAILALVLGAGLAERVACCRR